MTSSKEQHPNSLCYQCRRELASDARTEPWNVNRRQGPFFCTSNHRDTSIKRHYIAPRLKPVPAHSKEPRHEALRQQVVWANEDMEKQAMVEARDRLVAEYARVIAEYEHQQRVAQEQEAQQSELERMMLAARPIPEKIRYEHTHILGPTGSGKTTLIEQLVIEDLAKPDPPAMVIIDPKGQMTDRISKLQVFESRLRDRLIIIDPVHAPLPALNMFKPPPRGTEEQVIGNFAYIFSQAGVSLTAKMGQPFAFAMRLMFKIDGANLFTMMDLFDDEPKQRTFQPHIDRLDDYAAKRFFTKDFYSTNYAATREQIKARIYEIIGRPDILEMFNAPTCELDMFDCLQRRRIVLVNTASLAVGKTTSQLLGRFMIASTLNAAYQRIRVDKSFWNPAYLYIDEFQDYADEVKTAELLRMAREFNLGAVIAHQNMHAKELDEALRTTISTNTSIKYASSPRGVDQNYAARDLHCDADFLNNHTAPGTFACFASGMGLKQPFLVKVPFGNIERQPQLSPEAHRQLVAEAKQRLAAPTVPAPAPAPAVVPPPLVQAPTPAPVVTAPVAPAPPKPAPPVSTEPAEPKGKWWRRGRI